MPKYSVTVCITRKIECWGEDEDAAMDKACEIISGWKDVDDVEATDAEEL